MSSTVCAEQLQLQRFQTSQQKSHHLHNIDVPPRKQLLSRRSSSSSSPKAAEEESLFRKFLPYNSGYDDDEDDPYSADHFRMFEFKIRRCTRSRSHDWTDCPFAHPGEKARRRDPRRFAYSGTVCPEFRRGGCSKGDSCEFAHGVFECWLHPARYRTEACKDGKNCKRKVCFFAHTPKQLRVLPPNGSSLEDSSSPLGRKASGRKNHSSSSGCNHCCMICLHQQNCTSNGHNNNPNSPTSTLLNFSPPLSPIKNRESSRFSGIHNISSSGVNSLSYDEALAELVASLDVMNVASIVEDNINAQSGPFNYPCMDQLGCFGDQNNDGIYDQCSPLQQQNTHFILSPSSPQQQMNDFNHIGSGRSCSNLFDSPNSSPASGHPSYNYTAAFGSARLDIDDGPDIGWVNELLM